MSQKKHIAKEKVEDEGRASSYIWNYKHSCRETHRYVWACPAYIIWLQQLKLYIYALIDTFISSLESTTSFYRVSIYSPVIVFFYFLTPYFLEATMTVQAVQFSMLNEDIKLAKKETQTRKGSVKNE